MDIGQRVGARMHALFLLALGASLQEAARGAGICRNTLLAWRKADPSLAEAVAEARASASRARRRARQSRHRARKAGRDRAIVAPWEQSWGESMRETQRLIHDPVASWRELAEKAQDPRAKAYARARLAQAEAEEAARAAKAEARQKAMEAVAAERARRASLATMTEK